MSISTIESVMGGSPAEIVYDGQYHRFNVEGSKRRAGWYIAQLYSGLPIITFGNWVDGSKYTIRGDEIIDTDHQSYQRKSFDKAGKAQRTAELANIVWNHSALLDCNPYLDKKRIKPVGVKTLNISRIPEQYKNWFADWVNKHSLNGALIIPMMVGGDIVDLQFVTATDKYFLPNGNHKGAYLALGNPANSNRLIIATGYATANTLHNCMELPVYCVFSDGNIDAAMRTIRRKHPDHSITIAADNDIHCDDRKINSGLVYSTAAAKKYNLLLAVPELNGTKIDYNDLFIELGKQAVIDSVNAAVKVGIETIEIPATQASELMKLAIDDWLDSGDHVAIKAPAGLGKSTLLLQEIQQRNLNCDYFVPSYALAIEQAGRLPLGMAIAIRGRTHQTKTDKPLCPKWESVEVLNKIGLAYKTMPLLCGKIDHTTGQRPCPYSKQCGYLKQFKNTAPIRFYAHEYLPLDNSSLTKRKIDCAVIDETFHDSLEKFNSWNIGELMTQTESVYRDLVNAIMDNKLLEMSHLVDRIDEILNEDTEIESHLHPEMDYAAAAAKIKPLIDMRRKPTGFLWNCKKAMELNAVNRMFVGGKTDNKMIFSSYTKPLQFLLKETPTAYLDASLIDGIVKVVNPDCRIVKIDATRKAHITQITDSPMSKSRLMEDNDYLSSRLIHFMHKQVKINPNGAVIAPKDWIDKHKDRFPQSIKLAHFGALRGLNTMEHCDWLMLIGRNQPPQLAVEAIARAWWPEARLTLTGGYLQQQRTLEAKDGNGALVMVHTHADPRCREVLEAMREQESLQALDRLRLIHTGKPKQVWIFSNLPLPGVIPDELATFDGLTLPGRLAEVALRDGVVVTDRKVMADRYPDVFSTKKAAEREVRTWEENDGLNAAISYKDTNRDSRHLNSETFTYRTQGQRGKPRTVIVPERIDPATLATTLEAIHGKPVKLADAWKADGENWGTMTADPEQPESISNNVSDAPSATADPDARFVLWTVHFADGRSATIRDGEGMNYTEALGYAVRTMTGAIDVSLGSY